PVPGLSLPPSDNRRATQPPMNRFTRPSEGPLAGLKVLELGSDVSVAFGARILANLGAEVIKIEPPEGDPLRREPPLTAGGESAFFAYLNRGKSIVALDARTVDGWRRQCDLSAQADLVIAEPSQLHRGGREWRERPVTIAVSPHGLSGPGK